MSECQQEIQRCQLRDCIYLLGMRSDPERVFRIATATLHISPVENTWANVIAEAMFMEVPVALSNAGFTQYMFTHEKDCLIVPLQDPVALAEALQRLIVDGTLRTQLTRGASELLRRYKKDRISIVQEVRNYYDELQRRRAEISHHA
jgi:glycosyltransferase involved in cell wall biosynthesis